MMSPGERPQRSRKRRFVRRGATHAEQAAASEILAQLALAADSGSSLLETLHLPSSGRIRGITELPAFWVVTVTFCLAGGFIALFFPYPFPIFALVPLTIIIFSLRAAIADTALFHPVSLTEVELSQALAAHMADGLTLSQAMARLPRIFSHAQVAVARSGEEANALAPALRLLAKQAEARQGGTILTFRRIYPIGVLIVSMAPVAFILWRIIPKFVDIFEQLGAELPWLTMFVIRFSGGDAWLGGPVPLPTLVVIALCFLVIDAIQPSLGRLAAGSVCAYLLLVMPWPHSHGDHIALTGLTFFVLPALGFALPFIAERVGSLRQWIARGFSIVLPTWRMRAFAFERAAFFESLGLLLGRRVPASEALRLAAQALQSAGLERFAHRAARDVEQGIPLPAALAAMHLIRPRQMVLLRLAAKADTLSAECQRLGDVLTAEAAHQIAQHERIVRPLGIMVVGVLVGVFITALYLPLFNIPRVVGH